MSSPEKTQDRSLTRRRAMTALGLMTVGGTIAMAQTTDSQLLPPPPTAAGNKSPLPSVASTTAAPPPLVTAAKPETGPAKLTGGSTSDPRVLQQCFTVAVMDVQICAPEQGGILMNLYAKEGDEVKEGDLIAQLDNRSAIKAKEVADVRVKAAQEEADKDISIRYAVASAETAYADYMSGIEANKQAAQSVAEYDIRRYKLKYQESLLQIEQAKYEMKVAVLKKDVATAEAEAAAVDLDIRQAKSPATGVIVEKYRDVGEWLKPGDPIVRLLKLDTLYVQGSANAAYFEPYELVGKPVKIQISLARGRVLEVDGAVTFSNPKVEVNGNFAVRATIQNQKENGAWILRPGAMVNMTLQIDQP